PGHIQYTRNMVTGASTADLAIILVDARKGLQEQSRRHATLVSLLRVPHVVLAINKMDLVDWSEDVYKRISDEFVDFAARLEFTDVTTIPLSALTGDNVVSRSAEMDWFEGPSLLHHLENVYIASDRNLVDVRFPVQYVIRPQNGLGDYRAFAGQVVSGVMRPGDEVLVLPSGLPSRIKAIDTAQGELAEAFAPMSVTVRLEDEVDVSRGDMIVRPNNQPVVTQDLDAMVCWMDSDAMTVGGKYAIKHTTRSARALVKEIKYELDVNTLHRNQAPGSLGLNAIGRVVLRTTQPLMVDPYQRNRQSGSFILIDEATNRTVGAGTITEH
ncbi:MAG: sulfate adenylyltransferase, partial [Myxococcales bacterium]